MRFATALSLLSLLSLLALAAASSGCVLQASLDGRACDEAHPCQPDWHCSPVTSLCVRGPAPSLDAGGQEDAGPDETHDAGVDAGIDAGSDAGHDVDAGAPDAGPPDAGDLDGGTPPDDADVPVRLHAAMAPGQGVVSFAVLPDESGAIVLGDLLHPGRHELFRVRFDGTAPATLSPDSTFSDVTAFRLSPEGDRVLFLQDVYDDDVPVLLLADVESGAVTLVGQAAGDERIWPFGFSGDGQHAIWRKVTLDEEDLFAAALTPDAGAPRQLDQTTGSGGELAFSTTAGVSALAVAGDLVTAGVVQLHAVEPSDGATSSAPDDDAGVSLVPRVELSDEGGGLAVAAGVPDGEDRLGLLGLGVADGELRTIVAPPEGDRRLLPRFEVTPGGGHVVYAVERADGVAEMYAASPLPDAGPPLALYGAEPPASSASRVAVSPDGRRAALSFADAEGSRLYGVDLETGEATPLSAPNEDHRLLFRDVTFTPDGESLVYLANHEVLPLVSLYRVGFDGEGLRKLSGAASVRRFALSSDGATALYLSDEEKPGVLELFATDLETGARVRVSGGMANGGDVIAFAFVGNDAALYVADAAVEGAYELYLRRHLQLRGAGPTATPGGALFVNDPNVIARWFFERGGSLDFIDDHSLPASSSLTFVDPPNLIREPSPTGSGLRWEHADAPGTLDLSLGPAVELYEALQERGALTFELVVALEAAGVESRLIHIGTAHDISGPSLLFRGSEGRLLFTTGSPRAGYWWPVEPEELRHAVVTVVVNTSIEKPAARARLFVNGVRRSGAYTHEPGKVALERDELFDLTPGPDAGQLQLGVGNRPAGDRSIAGGISYAAIYGRALTDTEVRMNVERLLRSDDP